MGCFECILYITRTRDTKQRIPAKQMIGVTIVLGCVRDKPIGQTHRLSTTLLSYGDREILSQMKLRYHTGQLHDLRHFGFGPDSQLKR